MEVIGAFFTTVFIIPITNILLACYKLLVFLHIPYPLGFSIILLTVIIKAAIYPFVSAQIKSSYKMQKINPHISAIKDKHKGDAKKQQEEMMKLYKEHGVNPAAGCLPMLIQIPVIWSLYSVLTHVIGITTPAKLAEVNKIVYVPFLKIDKIWDSHFFGLPLSTSPSHLIKDMPLIILIPLLTGFMQFLLSKMMVPHDVAKPVVKKDDFSSAMQTQTTYLIPAMIGFFAFSLPLGLSLYWNTLNIFGILQQYLLVGSGSLKPWIEKIKKNGTHKNSTKNN